MQTPNAAVWFEIPADNHDRAVRFYETVLAVTLTPEACPNTGMRMGVFPGAGGASVSGCVVTGEGYVPNQQGVVVYLNGGDDLSELLSRVEAAGGKIAVPKTLITEEIGYFAHIIDSEGNRVGLHSRH
ncbi:VOC family protein [Azospirillum sp.]|uniref:VOC family protein n=1 Tax=Azospirillum sp. TaxID=34012 RepID=UPI002D3AE5B3|nr:VOC family protein [Azospirillum sp.]HYD64997.1 VOC family protein [Azospirillum sp.]